jgi:hypothetical protein
LLQARGRERVTQRLRLLGTVHASSCCMHRNAVSGESETPRTADVSRFYIDEAQLDPEDEITTEMNIGLAEETGDDDRHGFEGSSRGENWVEALEEHAILMGPAPDEEVVIVDDSDVELPDHRGHRTERRDRPVADNGSGGPAGL